MLLLLILACVSAARPAHSNAPWYAPLHWNDIAAAARSTDPYRHLISEEFTGPPPQQATFAMPCFWRGEGELGAIDGVIATTPGNIGPREVVLVTFNPAVVSYESLLAQARAAHVADDVFEIPAAAFRSDTVCVAAPGGSTLKPDTDGPKFYLQQSPLRAVPMTSAQACRVDGALLHGTSPLVFLSPQQRDLANQIAADPNRDWPNQVGVPIDRAWAAADKQ